MNIRERAAIHIPFLLVFSSFLAYSLITKSQWAIDNSIAIVLTSFMIAASKWLNAGKTEIRLFGSGLILHNLGTFGFYELGIGPFTYDNLVHFAIPLIAACILFNFVEVELRKGTAKGFHRHKAMYTFLVLASIVLIGAVIEIVEFFGFMLLGPGEGILFTGAGDSANNGDVAGQYIDTMGDMIINLLGALAGVLLYNTIKYKKRPFSKRGK